MIPEDFQIRSFKSSMTTNLIHFLLMSLESWFVSHSSHVDRLMGFRRTEGKTSSGQERELDIMYSE